MYIKITMLSSFTHPHIIPFLSSAEHKRLYFAIFVTNIRLHQETEWGKMCQWVRCAAT